MVPHCKGYPSDSAPYLYQLEPKRVMRLTKQAIDRHKEDTVLAGLVACYVSSAPGAKYIPLISPHCRWSRWRMSAYQLAVHGFTLSDSHHRRLSSGYIGTPFSLFPRRSNALVRFLLIGQWTRLSRSRRTARRRRSKPSRLDRSSHRSTTTSLYQSQPARMYRC